MLVELDNAQPKHRPEDGPTGPAVTSLHIPDTYTLESGIDVADLKAHLADAVVLRQGITSLPDHEALIVVTHPTDGVIANHHRQAPRWAWSDNAEMQRVLSELYQVPTKPDDVEDTHWTRFGPPGVGAWGAKPTGLVVNAGLDIVAQALGGGQVGDTGQATASSSTTLTTGKTYSTNQWAGYRVYASVSATQMVFGIIVSNTNAAGASVLTVDRWYTVATPGGAAGSTPSSTATFVICDGAAPNWFMGLTANSTAPASGDTSLAGEITTAGGGLVRKICPFGHTYGTGQTQYTLTPVFTANGSDSLPVTIAKEAVFCSMVPGDTTQTMITETALTPATATLSAVNDQLTVTETVTT